jgi:hypothetical protein
MQKSRAEANISKKSFKNNPNFLDIEQYPSGTGFAASDFPLIDSDFDSED